MWENEDFAVVTEYRCGGQGRKQAVEPKEDFAVVTNFKIMENRSNLTVFWSKSNLRSARYLLSTDPRRAAVSMQMGGSCLCAS
jgi:hypothetical protein